jgi:response regulator RpfG family c-di-GMP phosphodiesterase
MSKREQDKAIEVDNIQKLEYNQSDFKVKKKTMMICDDEPDIRLLFGLVFGSRYDVIMVDSGEDCIGKYIEETSRGNKISLILLDYKLGGMLGDSVARKIKECNQTKIILNSAYDVNDVLIKELENGNYISKYIQKPFDTDRITEIVAEII